MKTQEKSKKQRPIEQNFKTMMEKISINLLMKQQKVEGLKNWKNRKALKHKNTKELLTNTRCALEQKIKHLACTKTLEWIEEKKSKIWT